jgi:hypothetical protein
MPEWIMNKAHLFIKDYSLKTDVTMGMFCSGIPVGLV